MRSPTSRRFHPKPPSFNEPAGGLPELEPLKHLDLSEIYKTDPGAFLTAFLPLAHQVWAGEKECIEVVDILPALKTADIKESSRQKIITLLAPAWQK